MKVLPVLGLIEEKEEIVDLDVKDKKILIELSKNVRCPLSKISKTVGLSRDGVKYRNENFRKNKVLNGTRTLVNTTYLGYDSYHVFLKLRNPSKEIEKELIKKLQDLPYIRAILKFYGNYDFEIALIAKNNSEFDIVLTELLNKVKDYLNTYEILIITKSIIGRAFPKSFMKNIEIKKFVNEVKDKKDNYKPDKKDFSILELIRDNADLSLLEISEKTKMSSDSVSYRLKKLSENIILKYVPVINYHALGYSVYASLLNIGPITESKEGKISNFLRQNENVLWGVKTIGKYNVLLYICVKNNDEFQKTINEIRSLFPNELSDDENLLAVAEHKYTYAPDCLFKK